MDSCFGAIKNDHIVHANECQDADNKKWKEKPFSTETQNERNHNVEIIYNNNFQIHADSCLTVTNP